MKTLTLTFMFLATALAQEAAKPDTPKPPASKAQEAAKVVPPHLLPEMMALKMDNLSLRLEAAQREMEEIQRTNTEVISQACKDAGIELASCVLNRIDQRTGQPSAKGSWMIGQVAPKAADKK